MPEALVAFGGNIGDVRDTIDRAIAHLCDGRAVHLLARSADYLTPPWGITEQPPFVNCAISVSTGLAPHPLLRRCQVVEAFFGRDRSKEVKWGPRTIDVDLLTYDDVKIDTPDLTLPHPHLFERAFVLLPLADIAPDRVIEGRRIRDSLARAHVPGIVKLPPR